MKLSAHKIGAIFYLLWGLLHIFGGGVLLLVVLNEGSSEMLAAVGTAVSPNAIPLIPQGVTDAVLSFHAWNLLWFGLAGTIVAITLNWRNNRIGYWVNMGIVAVADIGLILFLLIPGYMSPADGIWGPLLWLFAIIFSTVGLRQQNNQTTHQLLSAS